MNNSFLTERLNWNDAKIQVESTNDDKGKKSLYLKGICIQGNVKNHNGRIYPVEEIRKAVNHIKSLIANGETIFGEADHPDTLNINLDRISHMIVDMWMDGNNGCGKLKIIDTPVGNIVKTIIECGGKLGVSSRGSGNVDRYTGIVSDFEIVTIDIVARPSAPNAYPSPVYERRLYDLLNSKRGKHIETLAIEYDDKRAKHYLKEEIKNWLKKIVENS